MDLTETPTGIVAREGEADTNYDFSRGALQFAQFNIAGGLCLQMAAGLWPALKDFAPVAAGFYLVAALAALGAVVGLFGTFLTCTFDTARRKLIYQRQHVFRPLGWSHLRTHLDVPFADVKGIGQREWSDEGGYCYRPCVHLQDRLLDLSMSHGSYPAIDKKLDELRRITGLPKLDT